MCGFAVSNRLKLSDTNQFCRRRGPDITTSEIVNGIEFLHNLLHITGEITPQPFIKNNKVAVFNGEIYNYRDLGDYKSDGFCIIDQYEQHGENFSKFLDGEYAICIIDFEKSKIIISTDTFACKPLWYAFAGSDFAVASYASQITGLGFTNVVKLRANTTLVFDLDTFLQVGSITNTVFDINQHKVTYDDWIIAFENSIRKRTAGCDKMMFMGLSSGYDSGAIACELTKQAVDFKAYSIINTENMKVLSERAKIVKLVEFINLDKLEAIATKKEIIQECEDFKYADKFKNYDIKNDKASTGLASICKRANVEKRIIYFSGQGADEIISDYGWNGIKIFDHSSFGGKFPQDLKGFFPWYSFWDGTQIQYLNKEEYIAGHYGIETRYPFLDKDLVQEFLWLHSSLKNAVYKSALHEYLTRNGFPFQPGEKLGFSPVQEG